MNITLPDTLQIGQELAAKLDDPEFVKAGDPAGIVALTNGFGAQCHEAVRLADVLRNEIPPFRAQNAYVAGLGGSAIAADLLRTMVDAQGQAPFSVHREYGAPSWCGQNTLAIFASYSGDTEETLSAYDAAGSSGAFRVCVTSGGELAKRAQRDGVPVCIIPGGQPPRTATGYMLFPMMAALEAGGVLCSSVANDVPETLALIDRLRDEFEPSVPTVSNPAKQLAVVLDGRIPIFTGSQSHLGPIAGRWKGQMNENAKTHAFASVVPEHNHNEVLGWKGASAQSDRWVAVALRDEQGDKHAPRHALRMEIVRNLVQDQVPYIEVFGEGRSMLARMFSLFVLGDYMSVYSALLAGADPNDIGWLYGLKAALKDGRADSVLN